MTESRIRQTHPPTPGRPAGSAGEVFVTFLKLGLTSFGGPIAHLGYFRNELVQRRAWCGEDQYAQLLAICQFLPGPASSQLGFSLGLMRAGWLGAVAAFTAFTLPSAALLFAFAVLLPQFSGAVAAAAIHGLKLVALAVVAHGVLGMSRNLCPDAARRTIAVAAAVVILVTGLAWIQLLVIVLSAGAGLAVCRGVEATSGGDLKLQYGTRTGRWLLALFIALLVGLPLVAEQAEGLLAIADIFYRAGALVFGGGHVVLPLLEESVVASGQMSSDTFLAGYGAAQAVPGPMFSFSAYLGASLTGDGGAVAGAATALVAIFLPGFLLVAGFLPLWQALAGHASAARAIAGVNAAVVGLLGAALYEPVWTSAVRGPLDVAIALIGFTMLAVWRVSAILVVLWCVVGSAIGAFLM